MGQANKQKYEMDKKLININVTADNWEEVLKNVSNMFIKQDCVKEGFYEALVYREREFPTGIQIDNIGVAFPHVDTKYVKKTAISVITLQPSVEFKRMDDSNKSVDVSIVFGLAVSNPKKHLKILQKIINLIQQENKLMEIKDAKSVEEISEILNAEFDSIDF